MGASTKTRNKGTPCYGTISYLGGWGITFDVSMDKTGIACRALDGCGEFPFDRFPNVPVIDFRTASEPGILIKAINIPVSMHPACTHPGYYTGTLESYLNEIEKLGIKIIRGA